MKLLDQVRDIIRKRHYSIRTEEAYCDWIKRFILYNKKCYPMKMGENEISKFLSYLARERKVAASTQNQALNALVFLYKQVLKKDLGVFSHFERAKKSSRLPLVLTRREIAKLLPFMNMEFQLMVELLYGAGLRLMECLRLRVKDIDFETNQIVVRDGKRAKDRSTTLPETLKQRLREHLTSKDRPRYGFKKGLW